MENNGLVVKEDTIQIIRGDMMKVLYFAHIKAKLDRTEDQFSFAEPITVQQFRNHLYETYPIIQNEKFQIAVNEEFVKDEDVINNQDTVALIPPVSGG